MKDIDIDIDIEQERISLLQSAIAQVPENMLTIILADSMPQQFDTASALVYTSNVGANDANPE